MRSPVVSPVGARAVFSRVRPQTLLHSAILVGVVGASVLWFVGSGEHAPQLAARSDTGEALIPSGAPAARAENERVHTIYIVGSQDQAGTLCWSLEDGNRIRAEFGLSPMLDAIAVVAAPADGERLVQAIDDGNRIMVPGQRDVRVVNLAVN